MLVVLWLSTATAVEAPPAVRPFLATSYARAPSAGFDAPAGAEFSATEFQLGAGVLHFATGGLDAGIGVDYQYTHYEYEGIAGRDRDLHRLQFPVNLTATRNGRRIAAVLAPGIATSSNVFKDPLDELTGDDLYVTGRVEIQTPMAGRSAWLAGLAYDRGFGEPILYPVAGVAHARGEHLWLRLAFPDSAARFAATAEHTLEARLFPAGAQWHVVSEEIDDDFDYRVEAWRAQFTWSYRPKLGWWRRLSLDASLGYEFARHHEFTDDQRVRIDTGADDEVFFAVGLRLGEAPLPYTNGSALLQPQWQ